MSVSNRDFEKISAYIDGEISPRERERLEARLRTDASLRQTLDQLQRTQALVRSLPILRAPRNFYLSPQMVGQRRPARRAFPILSFASVLASVLFVLIFLGDLLVIRTPGLSPLSAQQPAEQIVEVTEPLVTQQEGIQNKLAEDQADREMVIPEAEEETAPLSEPTGEMEQQFSTVPPTQSEEFGLEPREGISTMEEPRFATEGNVSVTPLPVESHAVIQFRDLVRISEVILVVVAVATGLAALLLHRKGRLNP